MHINNESEETKHAIVQKILDWIIPDSLKWQLKFFNFITLEGKHTNKNLNENKGNIKTLWKKIKDNEEIAIALELALEKQQNKKRPDENFITNTINILICNEAEIHVYKDLIKRIKKGEFFKKQVKLN